MRTRKNPVVELICWREKNTDSVQCVVGMPLKEDTIHLVVYSTQGIQGWTDEVVIEKSCIVERVELEVSD